MILPASSRRRAACPPSPSPDAAATGRRGRPRGYAPGPGDSPPALAPFGSLRVAPGSILRYAAGLLGNRGGAPARNAQRLAVDAAATMSVDAATLAGYLGELSATLAADATAEDLPVAKLPPWTRPHWRGT